MTALVCVPFVGAVEFTAPRPNPVWPFSPHDAVLALTGILHTLLWRLPSTLRAELLSPEFDQNRTKVRGIVIHLWGF